MKAPFSYLVVIIITLILHVKKLIFLFIQFCHKIHACVLVFYAYIPIFIAVNFTEEALVKCTYDSSQNYFNPNTKIQTYIG